MNDPNTMENSDLCGLSYQRNAKADGKMLYLSTGDAAVYVCA